MNNETEFDVEAMLVACVPGGSSCDPQRVADAIREYCAIATQQPTERSAELEAVQRDAWLPIETAPRDRMLLIAVRNGDESRTFVAEWSDSVKGGYWSMTSGWTGWTKVHQAWEVTHWMPLPRAPIAAAPQKGDK